MRVTQIYFRIHVDSMYDVCTCVREREDSKMLYIYGKHTYTYLFVQYREFKRCRIGNDFVSRSFIFPQTHPTLETSNLYEE